MTSILHLDFLGQGNDCSYEFALGGHSFTVRNVPLAQDLRRLTKLAHHHTEDCVALSGLSLQFILPERIYWHRALRRTLGELADSRSFSDGNLVRLTLERVLAAEAIVGVAVNFRDRRTVIFSGLMHYGLTELLATYTHRLIIGDMLWGFRLGVPLTSLQAFRNAAPALARTVVRTPLSWFGPSARRFSRRLPRFRWYFWWAEVIVGGMEYLQRYAPSDLTDKIVFTNLTDDSDLKWLEQRGVSTVVGLRARVGDRRLPHSVLGVALRELVQPSTDDRAETADAFLNFLLREKLAPEVVRLRPDRDVEPALIEPPKSLYFARSPQESATGVQPRSADEGVFAFIIHPLVYEQLLRHPILRKLDRFLPGRWVESLASLMSPLLVGTVRNVLSRSGARAHGYIFAVPLTSRGMLRHPPEVSYRKLLRAAHRARELGAGIMGLGAFASVVGDAGVTLARRAPLAVTTGNSFTVAVTLRSIERAAGLMGISLSSATACVIGATGSIGSILSLLLGEKVKRMILVSPRPERLAAVARKLSERCPSLEVSVARHGAKALSEADLVVTTTSAVEPVVDVAALKPGAVVCDVARPPDVSAEAAAKRPDVLFIESGEVQLWPGAEVNYDLGLPPDIIYGCLAETILLALERRYEHFTLGREISEAKVRAVDELGEKHGLHLAALRSFGSKVTQRDVSKIKEHAGQARAENG